MRWDEGDSDVEVETVRNEGTGFQLQVCNNSLCQEERRVMRVDDDEERNSFFLLLSAVFSDKKILSFKSIRGIETEDTEQNYNMKFR